MNRYSSTLSALAVSTALLVPGISQAKVYQSTQDPQLQSYNTTQTKQEACKQQGEWLSNQVLNWVRIKLETALASPKIVTISITQDPHSEEPMDYIQETNIDGNITKEDIQLKLPMPLKDFSIKIMNWRYISHTNCNS
jgi:hypothetical protein